MPFENSGVSASGDRRDMQQASPDRHPATACINRSIRIGNWNVRTLNQVGKVENLLREQERMKVSIMGISEMRWKGAGKAIHGDYTIIHSGGTKAMYGVGLMFDKNVAKCISGFWAISDRVLLVKLKAKPFDLSVIQVYAPTSNADQKTKDQLYCDLEQCKDREVNIIIGDLNAKVGKGKQGKVIGPFGLGEMNESGEVWTDWCLSNEQGVTNTWFNNHPRRLWTWRSPCGNVKNQIDFITINKRFRSAVSNCRAYPGANCNSDHTPVVPKVNVKLRKTTNYKRPPSLDYERLTSNTQLQYKCNVSMKNKFAALSDDLENRRAGTNEPSPTWPVFLSAITETAEEVLPCKVKVTNKEWVTEEIITMMDKRRQMSRKSDQYRDLNKSVREKCREEKEQRWNERCAEIEQRPSRPTAHTQIKTLNIDFGLHKSKEWQHLAGERTDLEQMGRIHWRSV